MRSFHLKDLISVQTLNAPEGTVEVFDSMYESKTILTKEEIMTQFKVDETSKESTWPYMFRIEFADRSFRLGARTSREFEEWIRIFNLIDKMNKMGHSITDKNPYVFEDQQKNFKKTNTEIADLAVDVHNLRDIPDDYRSTYHKNSNRKSK